MHFNANAHAVVHLAYIVFCFLPTYFPFVLCQMSFLWSNYGILIWKLWQTQKDSYFVKIFEHLFSQDALLCVTFS